MGVSVPYETARNPISEVYREHVGARARAKQQGQRYAKPGPVTELDESDHG